MLKKLSIFALTVFFAFITICSISCNKQTYYITFDKSEYNITGKTINVEYGDIFNVPKAYLTDSSGDELDVDILWSLKNEVGRECKNYTKMYYFEDSEEYTLTFTADTDVIDIPALTYKVVCKDTLAPTVDLLGLRKTYTVGEACTFNINNISDASGVNSTKTSVKAYFNGTQEVPVTNSSFALDNEGTYSLQIYVEDEIGNNRLDKYEIKAVNSYVEPVAANTLWGFESLDAASLVCESSSSGQFNYSISNEKVDNSGYSLKLDLKAGETINFYLSNGSGIELSEIGDIVLHCYATNLVDKLSIYSTIDEREIKFNYKLLKNKWLDLKFSAHEMFDDEFLNVNELKFKIWTEEDAVLYIDGIYTTDYVPAWKDETLVGSQWTKAGILKSGLLADFDEAEYNNIIGDLSGVDYSTPGGVTELIPAGDELVPTGASGGVLKFTTTTVPRQANASDQYSRDGFHLSFDYGIDLSKLPYLTFNVNMNTYKFNTMTVLFETDLGNSSYLWVSITPTTDGSWQQIIVTPEDMARVVEKAATTITGMHIRFLRNEVNYNANPGNWDLYIDSIEYYYRDTLEEVYEKGNYTFDCLDHLQLVDNINSSILNGLVEDAEATDGKALKVTTGFNTLSGVRIYFNNINPADYDYIIIRLRTVNEVNPNESAVSIHHGGNSLKYSKYNSYTNVNLKSILPSDLQTLDYIDIGRNSVNNIQIYIDSVIFVEKQSNTERYSFSENSIEPLIEWTNIIVGDNGIVEDADAKDGYALKITFPSTNCNCQLTFIEPVKVADYSSIIIRIKKDNDTSCYVGDGNETFKYAQTYTSGEYMEIDLIDLINNNQSFGENIVKISFWSPNNISGNIYIDSIVFTLK